MRSLAVVIALYGCYSPSYRDCEVLCTASQVCPSGYTCNGVHCVSDLSMTCMGDGGTPMYADAVTGQWGIPRTVFAPGTVFYDDPTLRGDLLEIFLSNGSDILVARRTTPTGNWPTPNAVTELTTSMLDDSPEITPDGLIMFFVREIVSGNQEILEATRASRDLAWGAPQPASALNSPTTDTSPAISVDGLTVVFSSVRSGSLDLFISNRAQKGVAWSPPTPLTSLNSPMGEDAPFLSPDKRTIYFASNRNGNYDLFTATRPTVTAEFGAPTRIMELNTGADEQDPWVAEDGRRMFFARISGANYEILETTR